MSSLDLSIVDDSTTELWAGLVPVLSDHIAIPALSPAAGGSHPRCVVLIEASEESGSSDLPAHVEALAELIGMQQLIVCLDSGATDYEHLWITTSPAWHGRRQSHGAHGPGGPALRRLRRGRTRRLPDPAPPARTDRGQRTRSHAASRSVDRHTSRDAG